jgi:NhaA family Na+:H+ antiporter
MAAGRQDKSAMAVYWKTSPLITGTTAGIGFTMSLFIAGQAYPVAGDFAVAKIAIFTASVLLSLIGVAVLWSASPRQMK